VFSILASFASLASARAATVHVQWGPNPAADGVISYNLYVDANPVVSVPTTVDPTCSCIRTALTLAPGSHTVKVAVVYLLISSDPTSASEGPQATATFTVNNGGNVINLKVTK
jgi:hypothetical protein